MPEQVKSGQGIPRLQELRFLLSAAQEAAHGGTYEDIRRGLIKTMADRAQEATPSGNSAARRFDDRPGHYVDNATGALGELMRIGLIERSPLPSTAKAARFYAKTRFLLTEAGVEWMELLRDAGEPAALDALLKRLWAVHPQMAAYVRLLNGIDTFFVPALPWSSVFPDGSGPEGRQGYVQELVARVLAANETGNSGWSATADELHQAIAAYTGRREAFAAKRGLPAYKRSRDFVRDCDEAVTVLALRQAGTAIDYISFEILRRWTQDLLIANFSYWVPGLPGGLRAWSTAPLQEADSGPVFERRPPSASLTAAVERLLPEAFAAAVREEDGSSFASIWRVRAYVCVKLQVNNFVFENALRDFQRRARKGELPFDLSLEVSTGGAIPPTERPFRGIPGRDGREPLYSLINVHKRRERKES
jgi:hypothetical protein